MRPGFWIKRFCTVLLGAFVVIAVARRIRGHDLAYAIQQGAIWAPISAALFTGARFFHSRRGNHCALCRDTPELRPADPNIVGRNSEPTPKRQTSVPGGAPVQRGHP